MAGTSSCLQRQMDELEALAAVYPEPGCLLPSAAERAALALALGGGHAPDGSGGSGGADGARVFCSGIHGTLRLPGLLLHGGPVALRFQLPPSYPEVEGAELAVECSAPRQLHDQLSAALRGCTESAGGEECLLLAAQLLQDEVQAVLYSAQQPAVQTAGAGGSGACTHGDQGGLSGRGTGPGAGAGCRPSHHAGERAGDAAGDDGNGGVPGTLRVVLWFHHIKNLGKRKSLVGWAKELGLRGCSKPGFPGVVVVEGSEPDVREYMARVRALSWQAMQVRGEQLLPPARTSRGAAVPAASPGAPSGIIPGAFPGAFQELPEDGMSHLGRLCREAGAEDLFLAALKLGKPG